MIRAILFDLDGVLVDACEWHYVALNRALEEVSRTSISRDEHIKVFNGLPTKKKLELLSNQGRVDPNHHSMIWNRKQELTKDTIMQLAKPDPVKKELHGYLIRSGLQSICITNSIYETARLMLECTDQYRFLTGIISNDRVRYPKPHPECYISGMVTLMSYPFETIIVEDSEVGLLGARHTGANVWAVPGYHEVTKENFIKIFKDYI
jgi:beta-phosphoglucomutase-like phosphatase (HAD superfamily)